ncbi:SDR family oxidoreductase [Cellulomonas soli]|uniref:SDR family oxidoreductase n=1 Tax=Cellulomonas soli TaxID=931535 RepID=UPI003F82B8DA
MPTSSTTTKMGAMATVPVTSPAVPAPVLVTGGTGTLGRAVVHTLLDQDQPVRVLSRRPRSALAPEAVEWVVGDLLTGEGLDDAVAGVRAIVHAATDPTHPQDDVEAVARLLLAARTAHVPHLLYPSIVGADLIPFRYYDAKVEAELLVEHGGVPWTILRATQFHDLVVSMLGPLCAGPVAVVPAGTSVQPVDVRDVAALLVALVDAGPSGRVTDLGGPEVIDSTELAAMYLDARGLRRSVQAVPFPGSIAAAYRSGAHLTPEHADGIGTFAEHLAHRRW